MDQMLTNKVTKVTRIVVMADTIAQKFYQSTFFSADY